MAEWRLDLAFDTDEPEFARGFEAGLLWGKLQELDSYSSATVMIHATNAEMAMRMAQECGMKFTAEDVDETFVVVRFANE